MKVSRTVWSGGKFGDNLKELPITIKVFHKLEKGVDLPIQGELCSLIITEPIAVLTPDKENVRQQGRRFKLPDEPMFTITIADKHGVVYCGYIRKLMPIEAWRLQGFTDEQFQKVQAIGMSDAQLYKQAGNAVTTNVVEAVARFILDVEKENVNGSDD